MNDLQDFSIADLFRNFAGNGILSDYQNPLKSGLFNQGRPPMDTGGNTPIMPQGAQVPQGVGMLSDTNQPVPQAQVAYPQQGPGILQQISDATGLKTDNFGKRLSNALLAAGSPDPAAAVLEIKKGQQLEEEAKKPKPLQLPNGDVLLVYPDGRVEKQANPEQQDFLKQKWDAQTMAGIQKLIAAGDIKKAFEVFQDAAKGAGGASATQQDPVAFKQSIQQTDNILKTWADPKTGEAKADNPNKIMGIESPLLAGMRDKAAQQVAPDFAPESAQQRRELDMFMKGQVAKNLKEMGSNPSTADLRFKVEQFPDPYKDSAKTITEWVKNYKEWLQAEENLRKQNVGKKDAMLGGGSGNVVGNIPDQSQYQQQAIGAWGSYEPNKYEYGINPATGKLARRPR